MDSELCLVKITGEARWQDRAVQILDRVARAEIEDEEVTARVERPA